jgi:hypothetical protein
MTSGGLPARVPNILLLRVSGLLESRVMGSKLELFAITQAS